MTPKRLLSILGLAGLGSAAYVFAGIMLSINPDGPPREDARSYTPDVPVSTVFVPIDVPFDLIEAVAMAAIGGKPVTSGTSTRLITDAIFAKIPVVTSPKPKRVCKTKRVTDAVERKVKCRDLGRMKNIVDLPKALGKCALSIGSAGITVVENVVKEVQECSIVNTVSQAVSPIPELAYAVTVEGLNMRMQGPDIEVEIKAIADLKLGFQGEFFNDLFPASGSKCRVPVTASTIAKVTVSAKDRELRLDAVLGGIDYAFDRGNCRGGLDGTIDFSELEDLLKGSLRGAVEPAIRSAAQNALNEQFANPLSPGAVNKALATADTLLTNPIKIVKTPVTLALEPEALLLSKTLAAGAEGPDYLRVQGGLRARPRLLLFDTASTVTGEIPVNMVDDQPQGFAVVPVAELPLRTVSDAATRVIREYLEDSAPWDLPANLTVTGYQSDRRVVIGVEAGGLSWLNLDAHIYLTARPAYDPVTQEITLTNVKFDAASTDALTNRAAWFLEGPIEHLLETNLRFPPDLVFRQVVETLADFTLDHEAGTVKIMLDRLETQEFWVDNGVLKLAVEARGAASVSTDLTELPPLSD